MGFVAVLVFLLRAFSSANVTSVTSVTACNCHLLHAMQIVIGWCANDENPSATLSIDPCTSSSLPASASLRSCPRIYDKDNASAA